jgi:hypothetical protein
MEIYLVIWDNGQEYDHEYKVIQAFSSGDDAKNFGKKWWDDYNKASENLHWKDQLYRREMVYIQEVNLLTNQ